MDIKDVRSLPRLVGDIAVGSKTLLTILRRGKVITVPIQVGEYEEAEETGVNSFTRWWKRLTKGVEIHGMTLQP